MHSFNKYLLSTCCVLVCQALGGGCRAQTKSLPPQLTAYQMISWGESSLGGASGGFSASPHFITR